MIAIKKIPWNKGKKNCYSEEHLKKLSKDLKGRKFSDETIRKMSKAKRGKNHPLYGKHIKNGGEPKNG